MKRHKTNLINTNPPINAHSPISGGDIATTSNVADFFCVLSRFRSVFRIRRSGPGAPFTIASEASICFWTTKLRSAANSAVTLMDRSFKSSRWRSKSVSAIFEARVCVFYAVYNLWYAVSELEEIVIVSNCWFERGDNNDNHWKQSSPIFSFPLD